MPYHPTSLLYPQITYNDTYSPPAFTVRKPPFEHRYRAAAPASATPHDTHRFRTHTYQQGPPAPQQAARQPPHPSTSTATCTSVACAVRAGLGARGWPRR